MKRFGKWLILFGLLTIIFFCLPYIADAQDEPEAPDIVAGDPDAPIDGGIGILLAVGIGYGVKKIRDFKKEKAANL